MTLTMVRATLRRITDFLRKITAPVQPWDWDELPVRHWWDVYAKLPRASPHAERQAAESGRESEGAEPWAAGRSRDRKSTRLNSSHQIISYAVFCLKKKK